LAGKRKFYGTCHICGIKGKLTFEHVPPKAAFNDKPILLTTLEDAIAKGLEPITKGETQQRGAGGHTLCGNCNNNTGGWYGNYFVEWTYQNLLLYKRSSGNMSLLCVWQLRIS
jgi:5-methylcytosine-specific restriction endonuclease McrA